MKLHKKAGGLLREWCDAQLFAQCTRPTRTSQSRTVARRASASGARVIYTERDAAWDAKNRYDLPVKLPLDWEAFMDAVAAHRPDDPKRLLRQIDAMLGEVDDTLATRVRTALAAAGDDASELARIANKLAARISSTPTDDDTNTTTKEESP
jgi:hypothetical protein